MRGTEFKIARIAEGKTQEQLAAELGIPTSYLSHFENGRQILTDQQIARLEGALPKLGKARELLGE